ncbi:hypothetical protein [Tumebacillus flagellatus]|uniref:Uncharacterized protein n=1 Tax=Tumebacillus flagellatus TaxID=1157490 RepID=A0A074LWG3_9BACL|nr:hypothetical protein [Tumebacillus flagellatus]KEO85209.1 hypothetical protein EL26_01225 [Tumebacillus flagellatus]
MEFDFKHLGYELTVKEIDRETRYGKLELAGLSGLGIEKVEHLMNAGDLPTDGDQRVKGEDFLNWVSRSGAPVAKQS